MYQVGDLADPSLHDSAMAAMVMANGLLPQTSMNICDRVLLVGMADLRPFVHGASELMRKRRAGSVRVGASVPRTTQSSTSQAACG